MLFGKGRQLQNLQFTFNGQPLEIVHYFKNLGIHFARKGLSLFNIKQLYDKGIKAMYNAISKCRDHNLSVDCKLDIFDKSSNQLYYMDVKFGVIQIILC